MLCCLMSPTTGCAFWSSLHDARLLDLLRLMLPLDLLCVMLCCLIFSKSCYATRSGLPNATLLECLYLMLRCWTFPTVCYVSWRSLSHVMLFDLVTKTVRCLIFSSSCYVLDLPLLCCLCCVLYILLIFLSGLHAATLLDFSTSC